jgi:hypothetical protein
MLMTPQSPLKRRGRPQAPISDYITKIETYLLLGYSLKKACLLGGIPYTTVSDHYRTNESIRTKIDVLSTNVSLKARANWVKLVQAGDYRASKEWLERMEPEEFSLKAIKKNTEQGTQEIIVTIEDHASSKSNHGLGH